MTRTAWPPVTLARLMQQARSAPNHVALPPHTDACPSAVAARARWPAVGRHAREQSIHTECDLACGAPAPEGLSLRGASMRDLPSVHTSSIRAVRLGAVAALLLGTGVRIGAAQQGTGSISGRVLDPTTKRALAGA